jgi:hypothetical protein
MHGGAEVRADIFEREDFFTNSEQRYRMLANLDCKAAIFRDVFELGHFDVFHGFTVDSDCKFPNSPWELGLSGQTSEINSDLLLALTSL